MGSVEQDQIASQGGSGETRRASLPKDATTNVQITEDGLPEDAPKKFYSKLSIWLMILYSGLALGSDG
jgi:hypothetical protein